MKKNVLRKVVLALGTVVAPVALVVSCSGETKSLETLTAEDFIEAHDNYLVDNPDAYDNTSSSKELYALVLNSIDGIDGIKEEDITILLNVPDDSISIVVDREYEEDITIEGISFYN